MRWRTWCPRPQLLLQTSHADDTTSLPVGYLYREVAGRIQVRMKLRRATQNNGALGGMACSSIVWATFSPTFS